MQTSTPPPSSNPLLTLLDLVDSPLLLFNPDGHVVFTNRAAKAMDARPGMVLPGDPQVRLLVQQIASGRPVASLGLSVDVNSDRGVSWLSCQCAPKPIAGLVAMTVAHVQNADDSEAGPAAPGASPQRLNLQQIVELIKSDLSEPIASVLAQPMDGGPVATASVLKLQERLSRLSDLVNVFGEDVLIGDERLMMPSMVRSVCQELTPRAVSRRVKFVLEGDKIDLPPVYGSSKLIRRALLECLNNAIDHTLSAVSVDQASAIRVAFQFSGQHLMIKVVNMGVLTAQALSRHAETLFQAGPSALAGAAKAEETKPTLQIGLPLTHRILELHGGRLRIEEDNGELEVKLELPTGAPLKSNHHLDLLQAHIYAEDLSTLLARSRKRSPVK